jgi:hypothetical protein
MQATTNLAILAIVAGAVTSLIPMHQVSASLPPPPSDSRHISSFDFDATGLSPGSHTFEAQPIDRNGALDHLDHLSNPSAHPVFP